MKDLDIIHFILRNCQHQNGYELSDQVIKLEINDKGVFANDIELTEENGIYSFEFENTKIPTTVIQTGNEINYILLIIIILVLVVLIIVEIIVLKKAQKKD